MRCMKVEHAFLCSFWLMAYHLAQKSTNNIWCEPNSSCIEIFADRIIFLWCTQVCLLASQKLSTVSITFCAFSDMFEHFLIFVSSNVDGSCPNPNSNFVSLLSIFTDSCPVRSTVWKNYTGKKLKYFIGKACISPSILTLFSTRYLKFNCCGKSSRFGLSALFL